jgi:hypothetical protein
LNKKIFKKNSEQGQGLSVLPLSAAGVRDPPGGNHSTSPQLQRSDTLVRKKAREKFLTDLAAPKTRTISMPNVSGVQNVQPRLDYYGKGCHLPGLLDRTTSVGFQDPQVYHPAATGYGPTTL